MCIYIYIYIYIYIFLGRAEDQQQWQNQQGCRLSCDRPRHVFFFFGRKPASHEPG